jgi:hypothetical protein
MPKQTFSKQPYFDDFNIQKNFMRVLFQPNRSIQVRELNQIQSIFNNQIEQFADHIFKFGSRVDAGSVRYEQYSDYVRLKDLDTLGEKVNIGYLHNKTIKGRNSGVKAVVKHVEDKTQDDPYTLYVNYIGAGTDGETFVFLDGETLDILDENNNTVYSVIVRCITCDTNSDEDVINPTGKGSLFHVGEATYYVYGYFVECPQQVIVLSKYTTTATIKVGLNVDQRIVTEVMDETLFDNALGQANYASAGADRYQINLDLVTIGFDEDIGENFIKLGSIQSGVLQEIVNKPQYADIMDMIARRTYDESGNYTVTPFLITPVEHLKESATDTSGFLTAEEGGREDMIAAYISAGKAYVKGYEVEKIETFVLPIEKARDTAKKTGAITRKEYGNFILVQLNAVSNFIPSGSATTGSGRKRRVFDFTEVDLYDAPVDNLSSAGNVIGTMKVKGMQLFDSATPFTDSVWKLNVFDMQLDPGSSFTDVQGLLATGMDGGTSFGANVVADTYIFNDSLTRIYNTVENSLLFQLPYEFIKSTRDIYNPTESRTTYSTPIKYYAQADDTGTATFVTRGDESITTYNQATWFMGKYDGSANFTPFEIVSTDITVSDTSITVANLTAFNDYFIVAECSISSRPEKTKQLTNLDLDVAADSSTIDLTKADVFEIFTIEQWSDSYTTYENALSNNAVTDVTANYTLQRNIKDNFYGISYLQLNVGVTTPSAGEMIRINFDYFEHGNTTNGSYFSVDSYTPTINDPDRTFTYENIPSYRTKDGAGYNLTDCLDFRPIKQSDGTFIGTEYIPSENKNIFVDIEYYLPRRDLLCVTDNGDFIQVKGKSSLEPKYPKQPENSMSIYSIDMKPYTFDPLKDARFKYLENRRYTMRDIGEFEKRLEKLRYYISLNLLDQELETMQVVDGAGNDRYKNGFLTDGFNNLRGGDVSSKEYRCAIDPEKGELRPQFFKKVIDLEIDENACDHYSLQADMITLPYEHELLVEQPYASKTISAAPFFFISTVGRMTLNPANDVWNDTEMLPDLIVDIDTGFDALKEIADAAGVSGTVWTNVSSSEQLISSRIERTTIGGGFSAFLTNGANNTVAGVDAQDGSTVTSRVDTVRVTTDQTGVKTTLEKDISNNSLGTSVTDVQLLTYMRPASTKVVIDGLPANMPLYFFFDGVDVTEDVRYLNEPSTEIKGSLRTDDAGVFVGVFTIPNTPTKRFYVGTKKLVVTNSKTNSMDPDEIIGTANCDYHAGGLKQTKQETVISTAIPEVKKENVERTITTTETRRTVVSIAPPVDTGGGGGEPLAQSFFVQEQEGIFLSKIDLYFQSRGTFDGIWLEVREMVNGYPGPNLMPYSRIVKKPESLNLSEDGSIPTTFEFEAPVYLQGATEYCFVFGTDDTANRTFISKLGGKDILTGSVIAVQPHMGSMFKGQNNRTWNASQYEDIKFKLYRAKFDISQNLTFVANSNQNNLLKYLGTNPLETEIGSTSVRVHHRDHAFSAGDKVKLNMLADNSFVFLLQSGDLVEGQTLTSANGSGIIKKVTSKGIDTSTGYKKYEIKLLDITGYFADGESVTGQIFYEQIDQYLLDKYDITIDQTGKLAPVGYFPDGIDNTFNGIPLVDLSKEIVIDYVDTMDSYIITVDTPATEKGRIGGSGIYAYSHAQIDAFNVICNYIDFDGTATWEYDGIRHQTIGSSFTNYATVPNIPTNVNKVIELTAPLKIGNDINKALNNGGNEFFTITGTLNSYIDTLSPVINYKTFSLETFANRIDWNDCTNASVSPNATIDGLTLVCGTNGRFYTEDHPVFGSQNAKYITNVANLTNPANLLTIMADVVDYDHSEIVFYYRIVETGSETLIGDVAWTELSYTKTISETSTDFKEIEINIPTNNPLTPQDELPDFSAFQVKIVMRSKNSAGIPKVSRLRCMATT